jgi:hypothetical protein
VHLAPATVYELTGLPSCAADRADHALSRHERDELAVALQASPLLELILASAQEARRTTLAYLEQEGFNEKVPSAIVDAGWGGWTSYAFSQLVHHFGDEPVPHLLIGVRGSADDLWRRSATPTQAWLFDEQYYPRSVDTLPAPHTLIEVLCAGTMGRTLDYAVEDDGVRPILSCDVNQPVVDWGIEEVQRTAERVAEILTPQLAEIHTHIDMSAPVLESLRTFWVTPTVTEAQTWGSFPWEEEIRHPYTPLAQRMTTREVIAQLRQGDPRIRRVNSWRAGSALVSSEPWSTVLKFRGWQIENRLRLRRVPRRVRLELAARHR